jgi:hypothetical protein
MGFSQTKTHRQGQQSWHQIGLVRGQFGDIQEDEFLDFLSAEKFDGWEEASWELPLDQCCDDTGAKKLAESRIAKARKHNLEIFSVATHLQGQALGDEPSAKTLQFVGGEAVEAYAKWRQSNDPPRHDPYFVPDEVGKLIHTQALDALIGCARLSKYLAEALDRHIPLPGFCGSPANCWSHWFLFPPLPTEIAGHQLADVRRVSLELIVERFAPFLDACREYGTTFDLECHPSERAMGDLESAHDWLQYLSDAGYGDVIGFNLDCSHLEWQHVSAVEFIREFKDYIHCVHIKGVQVIPEHCRGGWLGGHQDFGAATNGWNFVTAGSSRDAINTEEVLVELNRVGFDGALSIEWEDNDVDKLAGARAALHNLRSVDLQPSYAKHDKTLRAAETTSTEKQTANEKAKLSQERRLRRPAR